MLRSWTPSPVIKERYRTFQKLSHWEGRGLPIFLLERRGLAKTETEMGEMLLLLLLYSSITLTMCGEK